VPRDYTKGRSVEERFKSFVIRGDAVDDCWDWSGGRFTQGYGALSVGRRTTRAHRFSYALHYGPIPQDMFVLHHCDNPPCTESQPSVSRNTP